MHPLIPVSIFFACFFGGLGIFFIGIGVLWAVDIWSKQKKQK